MIFLFNWVIFRFQRWIFPGFRSFPFRVLHFSASFQQQHFQNFTFFLGSGKLRGRKFHAKISHLARNCEFGSPFWGPVSETVTRTQRLLREVPVSLGIVENLGDCCDCLPCWGRSWWKRRSSHVSCTAWRRQQRILGEDGWPDERWTTTKLEGSFQQTHQARWWFEEFFIFTPKIGEMIQFDYLIFFKWVGSTTN